MSVLVGPSYDNVVCLDIDGFYPESARNGSIEGLAAKIGNEFHLGDCLIILSSFDSKPNGNRGRPPFCVNYHLIYDQHQPWPRIWDVIRRLARRGILEKKLASLQLSRGGFTTRMVPKTRDGFIPFPIGFVKCDYPLEPEKRDPGGIVDWLLNFHISRNSLARRHRSE